MLSAILAWARGFQIPGQKPRLGSNEFRIDRIRFVIARSGGPVSVSGCGVQEIQGKGRIRRLGYLGLAPSDSDLAFSLVAYFSVFDMYAKPSKDCGESGSCRRVKSQQKRSI